MTKRMSQVAWVAASLVLLAFVAAVVMNYFPPSPTPVERKRPSQDDVSSDVDEVMKACSIGGTRTASNETQASLTRFFEGLSSGSKVSSSDIGEIADKITPGSQEGVALYKNYTDCLKEQMAIMASRRGASVVHTQEDDAKAEDEKTRSMISEITPDTPPERLVQIFGQPISKSRSPDEPGVTVVRYQYKMLYYAAEYVENGDSLGIVIATSRKDGGGLDQFKLNVVDEPVASLGNILNRTTFDTDAHSFGVAKAFGGSHADNYIWSGFLFPEGTQRNLASCVKKDEVGAPSYVKSACPELDDVKAMAVALASSEKDCNTIVDLFESDLDFGSPFRWPEST